MSAALRRALGFMVASAIVFGAVGVTALSTARPDDGGRSQFRGILLLFACAACLCLSAVLISRIWPGWRRPREVAPTSSRHVDNGTPDAVIRVERPVSTASDFFRAYDVRLDYRIVASLRIGEFVCLTVPVGDHTVEGGVADKISPPLTVACVPGAYINVAVEPTPGGAAARRMTGWIQVSQLNQDQSMPHS